MDEEKQETSVWAKPAFVMSQNIYASALYRLVTGAFIIITMPLLIWNGNRLVTGQDDVKKDVGSLTGQIIELRGELSSLKGKTDELTTDYAELYGRVNTNATSIAVIQSKQFEGERRGR